MSSPTRVDVLQVITDTDRRGAQVFATDLGEGLEHLGRSVRTVALTRGSTGGLGLPVLGPSFLSPKTLRALRSEAAQARTVIAHGSHTLPACAIALAASGIPFIYRQISDSLFWAPSWHRRLRVRLGLARAARVVALYEGSARTLHEIFGVPTSKIRIIPNGVPHQNFIPASDRDRAAACASLGLDPHRPTVTYVGALVQEKGVDAVIRAGAGIDGIQLLIAGDGPARADLEALASSTGAPATFTGSVPDIRSIYRATSLLVLASRGGDSMPAVLIEAGLMAIPSVATPVEGIPEIVVDGVTGRLVPVGDDRALEAALHDLTGSADLRDRLGASARARCLDRFTIDAVSLPWHRLLGDLTRQGQRL